MEITEDRIIELLNSAKSYVKALKIAKALFGRSATVDNILSVKKMLDSMVDSGAIKFVEWKSGQFYSTSDKVKELQIANKERQRDTRFKNRASEEIKILARKQDKALLKQKKTEAKILRKQEEKELKLISLAQEKVVKPEVAQGSIATRRTVFDKGELKPWPKHVSERLSENRRFFSLADSPQTLRENMARGRIDDLY